MRTVFLSILTEDLALAAFAHVQRALEDAVKDGADVVALPGAPVSIRAPEPVLERVLAAVDRR